MNLFVNKTKWGRLALPLVHNFIPIMLQLPSPESKPREHAKYLVFRLLRWEQGELESLMNEVREIQSRIKSHKKSHQI